MEEQAQAQGAPEGGEDPVSMLGNAIGAFVDGVNGSKLPDEVKKQAAVVQADFQKLVDMMGGQSGGGEEQVQHMDEMAGGNPNAVPVR